VSLYYADTPAVIKLLVEEGHSKVFAAFYDAHADAEWVSSALLRIELTRAVTRAMPALLPDARDLLLAFSFVAIDDDIVEAAMNEPDRGLRSLERDPPGHRPHPRRGPGRPRELRRSPAQGCDRCRPGDGVSQGLTAAQDGSLPRQR
jgi:hypothetical protein